MFRRWTVGPKPSKTTFLTDMRVLVIGAGYWGPNIVRNLIEFPEIEEIAVSDLNPENVRKLAFRHPRVRAVQPAPECFKGGYDAAFIVTPVDSHFSLAKLALEAGMHVFIEKPLARTSAEGRELIALAESKNLRLMSGHVFHYKPEVRALVDLVRSGELGDIRYMDSVRVNLGLFRQDVNVMWDLAPHDLTIFEAIVGRMPKRVSAVGAVHVAHPTVRQETMVHMTLDYGNECLAHVHVNWYSPLKQRLMVIAGTKKMAVYDDINMSEPIRVYDRGTYDPKMDTPAYPALRTGHTQVPHIRQEEPIRVQLREFFDAIRDNRAPATDGHAGLRQVRILEAGMTSLASDGRFIDLVE
jgi:predicted dehydrogenase